MKTSISIDIWKDWLLTRILLFGYFPDEVDIMAYEYSRIF